MKILVQQVVSREWTDSEKPKEIILLQSALDINKNALISLIKTPLFPPFEAISGLQLYLDSIESARGNLRLSLRRINYSEDTTFLINTILPEQSVSFFLKRLAHTFLDGDIIENFRQSEMEWTSGACTLLKNQIDLPDYTGLFVKQCTTHFSDNLYGLIHFTKTNFPFQYKQPAFRRKILSKLSCWMNSPKPPEILPYLRRLPLFDLEDIRWIQSNEKFKEERKAELLSEIMERKKEDALKSVNLINEFNQRVFEIRNLHDALKMMMELLRNGFHFQEEQILVFNKTISEFLSKSDESLLHIISDFDRVESLIPVTKENRERLEELRLLKKLPLLDKEWGSSETYSEEIEDDGTELGHFY